MENTVELSPELLGHRLSRLIIEFNGVKAKNFHDTLRSLVTLLVLVAGKFASLGDEVQVHRSTAFTAVQADVAPEGVTVLLRDQVVLECGGEALLESEVSVVLPATLEMGLGADSGGSLVRENHVFFLDDFRGQLGQSIVLGFVGGAALLSGGVHAEDNSTVLVCVAERVESSLALLVVVGVSEHVTTVAVPGGLGDFVVEEATAEALSKLFPSEPLEHVRFLPLTDELSGGPLGAEVVHGVGPGLARIGIELPSAGLLGGGPVGNGEALEHGAWLAEETDVTDAFEEGAGVEMLGEQVVHDIGFLVEFVAVNVLHAHAGLTGLFDMESVGNKEEVGMDEFSGRREELFNLVAGGKYELDPALVSLLPDVVFEGTRTDLSLSEVTAVYHSV